MEKINEDLSNEKAIDRRNFLRGAAAMLAAAKLGINTIEAANAKEEPNAVKKSSGKPFVPFVGIQMGPHTILDEGIEHTLDFIQETAVINAVMTYSHSFHGDLSKPTNFNVYKNGDYWYIKTKVTMSCTPPQYGCEVNKYIGK